ncbi:MAG: CHAD domain-containing protein [Burkholderiales bacterium]
MLTTPSPEEEVELKFALPPETLAVTAKRLARTRVLARRKVTRQKLHNIYFDTPDQLLRRSKMALRVRHMADGPAVQWVQTLKVGGNQDAALSRRGEWETPVADGSLSIQALQATPWSDFDPTGKIFAALAPAFTTAFERTTWIVNRRDGSRIEVALDSGEVLADGLTTPICELELELRLGSAQALFDVAREIAASVPLLPLHISKSERGYRLAQGSLLEPRASQAPKLTADMALHEVANCVLSEAFLQFTANLHTLRAVDNPEALHQARVGWRRFKSALKLFKSCAPIALLPPLEPLRPLLQALARMRDLDVSAAETLPMLARAYTAGDPGRELQWHAMAEALERARREQRTQVLAALQEPAAGVTLIEIGQWLATTASPNALETRADKDSSDVPDWALRRAKRLHDQLLAQPHDSHDPEVQHRIRILSKRLRYCVEFLRPVLPRRRAKKWHQAALQLQTELGASRDIVQTMEIVAGLGVDTCLMEFLRGVAAGQRMRPP